MGSIGHNGGPVFDRSERGWVAISRAMRGHPLVGFHLFAKPADPTRGAMQPALAFVDLIMECQYEDGEVVNGGRKMALRRGQMVGAVSWLANRWNWTPMAVRVWLDKLEADGMISKFAPGVDEANNMQRNMQRNMQSNKHNNKQIGKAATVITVCNYDTYQLNTSPPLGAEQQAKQQAPQHAKEQAPQQQYKDNKTNKITKEPTVEVDRKAINREAAREAFVQWQALAAVCGLPVPRDSSFEVYGQKIAARMFQHAVAPRGVTEMLDVWQVALANTERSSLLRGMTERGWKADLKFICKSENFAKLIDGGYGNGAHAVNSGAGPPPQKQSRGGVMRQAIEQFLLEGE